MLRADEISECLYGECDCVYWWELEKTRRCNKCTNEDEDYDYGFWYDRMETWDKDDLYTSLIPVHQGGWMIQCWRRDNIAMHLIRERGGFNETEMLIAKSDMVSKRLEGYAYG